MKMVIAYVRSSVAPDAVHALHQVPDLTRASGDGKVYVLELTRVMRIATGEEGAAAV